MAVETVLGASITARFTSHDVELPIGPLKLQISYELYLDAPKDFEDAVHLYSLFEEYRNTAELEQCVKKLGIEEDYDRLKRA